MKQFVIEQKITPMANQYRIFTANEAGEKQEQVAFVHQKRLAFREKFHFYADESKQHVAWTIQAREVLDFGARYDVTDEHEKSLGTLGKAFKTSLLRSTWHVFTADNEQEPLAIVRERSKALAIVRRVWQLIPILSDIPFFIKYHFDFVRPTDEQVLATYNKTTTFLDNYLLKIEDELDGAVDWRVLVSQGVLLDALQSR